ncbi:hypothetical protein BGZ47_004664 [Haplosporangium gracile]|nr:hypothetical protein BGZ47_004664 [Haplosporangium gracile]
MTTALTTNTKEDLAQKIVFVAGGVALILVGTTLISVTGPATVIQAFIQAGAAAGGGGLLASVTSTPVVASAMANGTLLVKQILLGTTVAVSSILYLFYSCIYPDMDTEKGDLKEQEAMAFGLKEFLMELVYRLRLRSRPGPGSYEEYCTSASVSPSSSRLISVTLSSPSSITSSSSSSSSSSPSTSSTSTVWNPDGTFILDDQNLTTASTYYVDRGHAPSSASSSPSSLLSSSTAPSGLRQHFTF